MALATQCPHCHTTFRVAHDQLKLRAGLVRCGACKQIFNGIENLLRPEDTTSSHQSPIEPRSPFAQPPSTTTHDEGMQQASIIVPAGQALMPAEIPLPVPSEEMAGEQIPPPSDSAPTSPVSLHEEKSDNPLLRMTLMDFTHATQKSADADPIQATATHAADDSDPLDRAIEDLQGKPWRSVEDDTHPETDELDRVEQFEYEEPDFVKQGRRRQHLARILRIVMVTALPFLLTILLAQATYTFRNQLAAWFPGTKPLLSNACAYIGCQVGLPMQIESVSIESSELQALPPDQNVFSLVVLLRNSGETVQAWPSIELTLNNANEKALARRVFMPRDYLPSQQDVNKGFASQSEQSVKVFLALTRLKASGYRVYLFYP